MNIGFSPIMLLLLLVGLILLLLLRVLGFSKSAQRQESLPSSASAGNRTSRITEAIVLLCAAVALVVFTATNPSTGGRLLMLDQFGSAFEATNIAVAICAAFGVLLATVICLLRRTGPATVLAAIVLCAYGWVLNGPGDLIERIAPQGATKPTVPYVLTLSKSNVAGAQLWVNGVLLGTTPVQTTLDEFLEKVPPWPDPPEGYRDGTDEVHLIHYSPRGSRSRSIHRRCMQFELPELPERHRKPSHPQTQGRHYYARVKLDGHWGHFDGGGGSGGSGGRYTYRISQHFPAVFPHRRQRLEKMLDKARLNDYRVGPDWFTTMETFDQDGPLAVYKLLDKEPDIIKALDDWAAWKYDLDHIADEKSAWAVFQRICAEADLLEHYSTASIAGRAVELITDRLDAELLVKKAVKLIQSTRFWGWRSWTLNGRPQFRAIHRPQELNRLQVSGYVVAHAVWMLDESLDAKDDSKPNIVEREVVPAVICWHHERMPAMRLAASLGGPSIERFLLRQNWRTDASKLPFRQRMHLQGEDANAWLFLLANLRGPVGRKFRRQHASRLMDMADNGDIESIEDYRLLGQNPFGFVFIDKDLALKYWPRFKARTLSEHSSRTLKLQFHYLANMEPHCEVQMYVDAWRSFSYDYSSYQEALQVLDRLPDEKREKVILALEQQIRQDVSNIQGWSEDEDSLRDYLLREIKYSHWTPDMEAQDIFANLTSHTDQYKAEGIAAWLEHAAPDHPLVKMLAGSDQPQLRLLVTPAIQSHPTPQNRQILEKLLNDGDEAVKFAAMTARHELEALAAIPVDQLAQQNN